MYERREGYMMGTGDWERARNLGRAHELEPQNEERGEERRVVKEKQ